MNCNYKSIEDRRIGKKMNVLSNYLRIFSLMIDTLELCSEAHKLKIIIYCAWHVPMKQYKNARSVTMKQDQRSTALTRYQLGPLSHLGHFGSHLGPSGNYLGPFGRHLVRFGSHTS